MSNSFARDIETANYKQQLLKSAAAAATSQVKGDHRPSSFVYWFQETPRTCVSGEIAQLLPTAS